jgi:hypothetical protein
MAATVFYMKDRDARLTVDDYLAETRGLDDDARSIVMSILSHNRYHKVAIVRAADADSAYTLTQNIFGPWCEIATTAEVFFDLTSEDDNMVEFRRSSQVGDIFIIDGKAQMVVSAGFLTLDQQATDKLLAL